MTRPTTRFAGALAVTALLLAACGASATPAPSSAPAPEAPGSPTETQAAPATAAATAEPSPPPAIETAPAAADTRPLEERLPTTYGGVTLQKVSVSGADAVDEATRLLLEKHGKTPADVTAATAFGESDVIFVALQVNGLGEDALRELMVASAGQSVADVAIEEVSLGGQRVYKTTVSGSDSHGYFIVRGDTAIGVTAASDEVAAGALAAIP
jgi:hypothetical protein